MHPLWLIWLCLSFVFIAQGVVVAQWNGRDPGSSFVVVPLDAPQNGNAALLVGVNKFHRDRSFPPLQFAVHDAIELAYLFVVELKLIPARNCVVAVSGQPSAESVKRHWQELCNVRVTVTDANKATILKELDKVVGCSERPSDLLIVSCCSHGFDEDRTAYLLPSDGLRKHLADTAIRLTKIESTMEKAKAGHRLLLVDACQERVSTGTRGDAPTPRPGMSAAFVKALQQNTGQVKLASCDVGQYSHESYRLGGVGHGVFSFAFLEALRGGAAPDKEDLIRLGAAFKYVDTRVRRWVADQNQGRPAESALKEQFPSWHGPVKAQDIPLAARGSDLQSLIANIRSRVDPQTGFDSVLCERLLTRLNSGDTSASANRQLHVYSREFAAGNIAANLFVPFLKQELAAFPQLLTAPCAPDEAATARDAWARHLNRDVILENPVGMKLSLIPPGEFLMGSPETEAGRYDDERQHKVRVSRPFYLGVHEVTQDQYERVMDANPSWFSATGGGRARVKGLETEQLPVESLSWNDAAAFCRKLSESEGTTYRLPTEAEWEYACGAAGIERQAAQLPKQAWFMSNADYRVHTVGQLAANHFGLHDMLGNVSEWCSDWYEGQYYRNSHVDDPVGPASGGPERRKVLRGGNWISELRRCRPAFRSHSEPDVGTNTDGFRVVLEIETQ